jgi:GT2 family glycosyltransferase
MELTLVIPTRDRLAVLLETLARLRRQRGEVEFEAIVVDDGSRDGTPDAVEREAAAVPFELTVLRRSGEGPAAARNAAIAVARAPVCLFLNDDAWPRPDLLERHRNFHAREPAPEAALLGRIDLPAEPPPTPFMRWLARALFDFDGIEDPSNAGGARFFTANVSAKTELLRRVGGFDERFPGAAHEDIDLGLRLERAGMRLAYDPAAVVEHSHPMDLPSAIARLHGVGSALAPFAELHSDWPVPRRPGPRHRMKAGALTGVAALGVRTPRLQREIWRFLCHEAAREGYWGTVDRTNGPAAPGSSLRVGGTLARLASRDPDARMPAASGVDRDPAAR